MSEAGSGTAVAPSGARPHRQLVATSRRPRDYLLRRALAAADLVALAGATAVALAVSPPSSDPPNPLWLLPVFPAWLVLLSLYGLYDRDVKRVGGSALDDLPGLFHAYVLGTLALWAWLRVLDGHGLPLVSVVAFGAVGIVAATALRVAARAAVVRLHGPSRVLLVGSSPVSAALARRIAAHPEYGLEPVGELVLDPGLPPRGDLPRLGELGDADLAELLEQHEVERVIVTERDLDEDAMMDLLQACGPAQAKVSIVPNHINALGPSVVVDDIEGVTLLGLNPLVLSRSSRALKRGLDLAGALVGGLLALPLAAVIAVAIKLDSPGPVLFRQRRIGRRGEPFTLLKFRTMVVDAEERAAELRALSDDPDWLKLERDPRVTRVGRLLRATSLDELPQLWNVLVGEMSLVGPRPLIDSEDALIAGWSRARLDLAPGLTGMWQVLGRTEIPFRDMVGLDCLYVTNWSLWLDIKLIARTVPAVLSRRGAN